MKQFLLIAAIAAAALTSCKKDSNGTGDGDGNGNPAPYEVWMRYAIGVTPPFESEITHFVKYANGDCLDNLPEEGLMGLSKATDKNISYRPWGAVQDKGDRIVAAFPVYVRRLVKKSVTEMIYNAGTDEQPALSIYPYFKCASVDGLKLEGQWSAGGGNPDWYKNPNYTGGSIIFYNDGRFENNEELVAVKVTGPNYNDRIYRTKGTGTYYFKDYTLVLTYSDGAVFTRGVTGLRSTNPQNENAVLYFGEVPFYKNLNK